MSKLIEFHELSSRLEEVLASAAAGDEIILTQGATHRARLIPLPKAGSRIPGLHPAAIQTAADFDAPLAEEFFA